MKHDKQSIEDELLDNRIDYLDKLILEKERAIECAPEGILRGNPHRSGFQYYRKRSLKDEKWEYIRQSNIQIAKSLAQKVYDQRVQKCASRELQACRNLKKVREEGVAEDLYAAMPEFYHNLVRPVKGKQEELFRRFIFQKSKGKGNYDNQKTYRNKLGERMRSKSERDISNLLIDYGIPYIYEKPLTLTDSTGRDGIRTIYPDFSMMDFVRGEGVYLEHMGLWDDEDYRNGALKKILLFEKNGILINDRLFITIETGRIPLDFDEVEKKIQKLENCMAPDRAEYDAYIRGRMEAEAARKAEEEKRAEEARQAEETRQAWAEKEKS